MRQEVSYDTQSDESQGFWGRMRDRMFGPEEEIEEEMESPLPAPGRPAIRLHNARTIQVDIRRTAVCLEDSRHCADGLKSGRQQLVNLENTPPQSADRLVDFLSGVTYALDGTVERVGDKVYLFAPANVHIEMDSAPQSVPESNATWGT